MAPRLAAGVRDVGVGHAAGAGQRRVRDLPAGAAVALQREFKFYVWDEHTGEVRWMCSWDTTEEDVDAFVAAILDVVAEGAVAGGEHRGL